MKTYQKPHNKTKRILAYRLKHPKSSIRSIANALKETYSAVYNALFKYDAYKPANAEDKFEHLKDILGNYLVFEEAVEELVQEVVQPVKPSAGQEVLRKEIARLNAVNEELTDQNEILETVLEAVNLQRRGLENVIQYLEAKLGIDEIDARLEATKD